MKMIRLLSLVVMVLAISNLVKVNTALAQDYDSDSSEVYEPDSIESEEEPMPTEDIETSLEDEGYSDE